MLLFTRIMMRSASPSPSALFFAAAATKRILDLQKGPCILVAHSYGGSIITEAGIHPNVVGLVYVAAHAPDVGEDEGALGKRMPSATQKQKGAIKEIADGFTFLDPADFYKDFAADLPREQAEFGSRSQILTAAEVFTTPMTAAAWKTKPSWAIVAGADRIINPDLERWYYARAHSHTIELEARAIPSTNRVQRRSRPSLRTLRSTLKNKIAVEG